MILMDGFRDEFSLDAQGDFDGGTRAQDEGVLDMR